MAEERSQVKERKIRVMPDKSTNQLAIHDVDTGELLHQFLSTKDLSRLSPQQMAEQESEAIRDFAVNGVHPDLDEEEQGW